VAIRDLRRSLNPTRLLPEPQISGNLKAGRALSDQAMEFCEQRDNANASGAA